MAQDYILITGATGGLGKALVEAYTKAGEKVIALGRNLETLKGIKGIVSYCIDFDNAGLAQKQLEIIQQKYTVRTIIHSAGTFIGVGQIENISLEDWEHNLRVNFFAAVQVNNCFIPHMKKKGSGCIIHVGSMAASKSLKWLAPYCVSKAAIHHYTTCLATELKQFGIRVNTVGISADTALYQGHRQLKNEQGYYGESGPAQSDMPLAEDNIAPIIFLTSDAGKNISGQYFEAHLNNL